MKRRLNSQRGKKNRTRVPVNSGNASAKGNRRRNAQGESLGIERPVDRETDRSPKDIERPRESYGFIEPETKRRGRSSGTEGETVESPETSMDVTEKSRDPYSEEEGRPDQIAEGKGRESDEMSADRLAGAEPEVEPSDIEEGDEESRGGSIRPDNPDNEELRRRRKGGGGKFQSNTPE